MDGGFIIFVANDLVSKSQFPLDERQLLLRSILFCPNPVNVDGLLHVKLPIGLAYIVAEVVSIGAAIELEEQCL